MEFKNPELGTEVTVASGDFTGELMSLHWEKWEQEAVELYSVFRVPTNPFQVYRMYSLSPQH